MNDSTLRRSLKQFGLLVSLSLMGTGSALAQWSLNVPPSPDYVLPFRTDINGSRLPAATFGLTDGAKAHFTGAADHVLIQGRTRVRRYDLATGAPIQHYGRSGPEISALGISRDESVLALAHTDGTVVFWHMDSGFAFRSIQVQASAINTLALSPKGRIFATGDHDGVIRLWDLNAENQPTTLLGHELDILNLEFDPSGDSLLSVGRDRTATLWNVASGETELVLGSIKDQLIAAGFNHDGSEVITAHRRRPVYRIFDRQTGEQTREIPTQSNALAVAFAPEGLFAIASAIDGRTTIQSLNVSLQNTEVPRPAGNNLGVSAAGDFYYRQFTVGGNAGANWIEVYRADRGAIHWLFPAHAGSILGLAFSPDAKRIISSGLQGATRVTDIETGHIQTTVGGRYTEFSFSPSGTDFFVSNGNHGNWGFSLETGEFTFQDRTSVVSSIGPNRYLLVHQNDAGEVWVEDRSRGQRLPFLEGEKVTSSIRENTQYVFSPDQRFLASESMGEFKLWEVDTGERRFTMPSESNFSRLLVFPDNHRLATLHDDGRIIVWDLELGRKTRWFFGNRIAATAMAISHEGSFLAAGTEDGGLHVIHLPSGGSTVPFAGHDSAITAIAFSRDDQQLVTGDEASLIKLWQLADNLRPIPQTAQTGATIRLGAQTATTTTPEFRWTFNGRPIENALVDGNSMLVLNSVDLDNVGQYQVNYGQNEPGGITAPLALTVYRPTEELTSYDRWAEQFPFPNATEVNRARDSDGDGMLNYEEFLVGSHPLIADEAPELWQIVRDGDRLSLALVVAPYVDITTINFEQSPDLGTWEPIDLDFTKLPDVEGQAHYQAEISRGDDRQFIRLR